ncbi:MAG: hypothetical protein Q9226_006692 [Calogaya cf. arnoldii]
MALPTTPPILSELRSSTSSINQVAALRALKNEIIGHEQKKRDWVGLGVLAPLARILNTPRANGKRRESNGSRSAHHGKTALGRTDEEEARLQAIIVVGSLASVPHDKKPSPWPHHSSASPGVRLVPSSRLDSLLPQLPVFSAKRPSSETNHHPPIGSTERSTTQSRSTRAHNYAYGTSDGRVAASPPEEESPLLAWLIYVARAKSGLTRLMAAWLVSLFYGSGLIDKRRDVSCAMLLVPLLVRMLEKGEKSTAGDDMIYDADPLRSAMPNPQVQAPAILAMLTLDSLELQRAAVDAGAIKKLSQLLKHSYDPLPTKIESQWTREPSLDNTCDSSHESVGSHGFTASATTFQRLKLRESVLKALASIASISDEYRKSIIADGAVSFIIESLKPKLELPSNEEDTPIKADVNHPQPPSHLTIPTGVLIAACATAKSLTRSVSTLRTSLMDAGLAAPVFVLLEHPDVRVQIAATEVVSNLVLEFSPMREVGVSVKCHG